VAEAALIDRQAADHRPGGEGRGGKKILTVQLGAQKKPAPIAKAGIHLFCPPPVPNQAATLVPSALFLMTGWLSFEGSCGTRTTLSHPKRPGSTPKAA